MNFNSTKINIFLLTAVFILFSYYIYQTISISSESVSLVNLKKEFLERKNDINLAGSDWSQGDFNSILLRENLKMTEIENFDYLILGPSEFALIENTLQSGNQ